MNIEVIFGFVLFALFLGVILAIPGLWWARRKAKKLSNDSPAKRKVTFFGFVFTAVLITLLLLVVGMKSFAPEITDGKRIGLIVFIIIGGMVLEKLFSKLGFKMLSGESVTERRKRGE